MHLSESRSSAILHEPSFLEMWRSVEKFPVLLGDPWGYICLYVGSVVASFNCRHLSEQRGTLAKTIAPHTSVSSPFLFPILIMRVEFKAA